MLKEMNANESPDKIMQYSGLWKYLDELKPSPKRQLYADHTDTFIAMDRGYGDYAKPEDYLESFEKFIKENQNKIEALKIICTKPAALDRQSLKELRLKLDAEGFSKHNLNAAWMDTKNEDIAADIIAYIRTLTIGTTLMSKEERIKRAMDKIRKQQKWTKKQANWLGKFELQLQAETVLQKENLNQAPFNGAGGFVRLNKIFDNQLDNILNTINENLYKDIA